MAVRLIRPLVAVGVSVYAALWITVLVAGRLLASVPESIPPVIVAMVLSVLGPPVLLAVDGAAAWAFVLIPTVIVGACLTLSRYCWRRDPDSELFGLPLLAAVAVWVGSVWLAALVATI